MKNDESLGLTLRNHVTIYQYDHYCITKKKHIPVF